MYLHAAGAFRSITNRSIAEILKLANSVIIPGVGPWTGDLLYRRLNKSRLSVNSFLGWLSVLYVHRNRRLISDGSPGRPTSTFTQLLSSQLLSLDALLLIDCICIILTSCDAVDRTLKSNHTNVFCTSSKHKSLNACLIQMQAL